MLAQGLGQNHSTLAASTTTVIVRHTQQCVAIALSMDSWIVLGISLGFFPSSGASRFSVLFCTKVLIAELKFWLLQLGAVPAALYQSPNLCVCVTRLHPCCTALTCSIWSCNSKLCSPKLLLPLGTRQMPACQAFKFSRLL